MRNLNKLYENCRLCPKICGVDRLNGQPGICRMPAGAVAASAVLHKGEEPPLIGKHGSGAIFFSGCTLGCPFCQNAQISIDDLGSGLSDSELAGIFLKLQERGAANINLVTASQFTPSVIAAADEARGLGLQIPIMWNSSGYETPQTIKLLSNTIDIWLPDIKTLDSNSAGRLFDAPDYPITTRAAILKMADQLEVRGGTLIENDLMKRGMIVRHLVMPGEIDSSREVFEWFAENLKDRAMLSVMVQYTPVNAAGEKLAGHDYIMPDSDYKRIMQWLEEFEIEEGFLQAPEAASKEWIPDFNRPNPFPEKYSSPIWHWRQGLL